MIIYKNCISINTGIMEPHTLKIENIKANINYINNFNKESIIQFLVKDNYQFIAIAFDQKNRKYYIFQNNKYTIAIKYKIVKKLTVPEMIKKYNLTITEQEYKKIFNIT